MPHTPTPGDRRDGEFADLFARKTRTPLRGFLPGRRVWNAVGGSAAAVLVIAGSATAVAAIDWDSGSAGKVTTAAEEPTRQESSQGDADRASAAPSPRERTKGGDDPDVVYVPVSGGAGAGTSGDTPGAETKSDADGTTGDTSGSTGSSGTTGASGSSGSSGSTGTGEQKTTTKNTESEPAAGYLWADGSVEADSNAFWDQSTITVRSTKPIASLKVVVRVIQTGGVSSTGTWTSLGDRIAVGQNSTSDQLGYVFTLKSGVTLAAGTYVFKVQYDHAEGGRDAGRDLYTVTAVAGDSEDKFLSGRF
ncbi:MULTISPECIES: hypothetical protein [Streptomyces]|uniref:Uncharacterized protein n=1 Tax=Streptomyces griseiscabiei TaxID=2993540 RepID=A0ABU4LGD1_9ACTN|nr:MULTISPECIES: hypothetical protein [Streptomyces]MBZ3904211.1 hypothetical protein [Streptomyces griseiscabiei]MDX2914794.1 hypothetical protein [Streptomyces griseiscabiei]